MGKSSHLRYAAQRKPSASGRRAGPRSKAARGLTAARQMGWQRRGWAIGALLGQLVWQLVRVGVKLAVRTVRLLWRYPAIALLIGWALLVGVAIAATTTIMNPAASVILKPGAHPGMANSAAPVVAASPASPAQTNQPALPPSRSPSPLPTLQSPPPLPPPSPAPAQPARSAPSSASSTTAALSLILMSCSLGCLLLSRSLKPRSDALPRRPDLTNRPRLAAASTPEAGSATQTPAVVSAAGPERFAAVPAPDLIFEQPFEQVFPAQLEAAVYAGPLLAADETDSEPLDSTEPQPVDATIVPAAQDHPLDWSEPSLADSLDLRQRRPLSYWLG